MLPRHAFAPALLLALLACGSDDPRLPQQLYDDAVKMNQSGRGPEAKAMMDAIIRRFPDSPAAQQAKKDLYLIEAFLKQENTERQKQVHASMKRIMDALTRYKGKHGEYPDELRGLVPEYLDQVPETPWNHPFFYRPFVPMPIEDYKDRKGNVAQRFNTKLESYYLVCMGTDLQPGGGAMAADVVAVNGEFSKEGVLSPVPMPQPVR